MGLYDHVELEEGLTLPSYPEEAPSPDAVNWQTKDIDRPLMATFRITTDGRLLKEECHYEEVPPEERPYADNEDVDENDFRYFVGMRRKVHDGWIERRDYHGRFRMIASVDRVDGLLEYRVTFTHGRLEGFERWAIHIVRRYPFK